MTLPLSHIKVAEFCIHLAGPYTAMLLADQGADVIKLETFEGDSMRGQPTSLPDSGFGLAFLSFNRNKRAIAVDYTRPKGLEVAYNLARWADVLVINMRLKTRQRRGFTYEELAPINPRLVYASITGYGEEGPDANFPGADVTIQGRVGDLTARRFPEAPMPRTTRLYHFDMATAMLGAYAVTLALYDRERTGHGQRVELNLLQSALACQNAQMTQRSGSQDRYGILPTGMPIQYPCSDGRYLLSQSIGNNFEGFCQTVGLEWVLVDPRFDTPEHRGQHAEELAGILGQQLSTRPAAEWEAMLKARDIWTTVVHDISEVYDDPQVVANQMMTKFEQP
ncbi:MAG: CoA transferase, partial [Chloroflexota bacterium]